MSQNRENISMLLREKTYKAEAALIVYSGNHYDNNGNQGAYAEIRPIQDGRMRAGKPISKEAIRKLLGAFDVQEAKKAQNPCGTIPDNLLYADPDNNTYVWYTRPGQRNILFEAKGMKSGVYHVPGMVYRLQGRHLSVWAFKGNKPNGKTRLLHAPFFNVYESGNVCLGNATHEIEGPPTWQKILEHGETLFWGSRGSHTIYWPDVYPKTPEEEKKNLKARPYPKAKDLYEACKDKPFDADILVPTDKTLSNILH